MWPRFVEDMRDADRVLDVTVDNDIAVGNGAGLQVADPDLGARENMVDVELERRRQGREGTGCSDSVTHCPAACSSARG
jgi:hypothetical protein